MQKGDIMHTIMAVYWKIIEIAKPINDQSLVYNRKPFYSINFLWVVDEKWNFDMLLLYMDLHTIQGF